MEANEHPLLMDDILEFANIYGVDVRELILEEYVTAEEEEILCKRYASFIKILDQLSDKDREDIIWVIKQRVNGRL